MIPVHWFLSSSYLGRRLKYVIIIHSREYEESYRCKRNWASCHCFFEHACRCNQMNTYCQMSRTSLGAHSLFSFSTMAKPPRVHNCPPQLPRLTELLSWGNSVKGDHLQQGWRCIHVTSLCCLFLTKKYFKNIDYIYYTTKNIGFISRSKNWFTTSKMCYNIIIILYKNIHIAIERQCDLLENHRKYQSECYFEE